MRKSDLQVLVHGMIGCTFQDPGCFITHGHPDPVALVVQDHHRIVPVPSKTAQLLHPGVVVVDHGVYLGKGGLQILHIQGLDLHILLAAVTDLQPLPHQGHVRIKQIADLNQEPRMLTFPRKCDPGPPARTSIPDGISCQQVPSGRSVHRPVIRQETEFTGLPDIVPFPPGHEQTG